MAVSSNVGNVKVILGDTTNVSTVSTPQTTGHGLRMDDGRQDIARITRQVLEEEGDIFDFVVVFPAFDDLLNPGFAYFNSIRNTETGIGLPMLDLTSVFGSQGRLQGFVNMNTPEAYRALDGRPISDPDSAAFGIMGQEMTHRWLAFARVKKAGFNDGQVSSILMGRDQAHWSALMHTGPADMSGDVFVSVQDGVAWLDNGNGTFTVAELFSDSQFAISNKARFTSLDLYLMGLLPPAEVEPFYAIAGARMGTTTVPASARLERGITVSGQRVDLDSSHVIAALGARMPGHETAQHAFSMAVVVLTRPGQTLEEVLPLVEEVDAFRRTWEERFKSWTGARGTLCSSLSGNCTMAHVTLSNVRMEEDQQDGVLHPGEWLTVHATVENLGEVASQDVAVLVDATAPSSTESAPAAVGVLMPGGRAHVQLRVRSLASFPCNTPLTVRVRAQEGGNVTDLQELSRVVGVRVVHAWQMEEEAAFMVNPDGTDTALRGAWARGRPQRTDLRALGSRELLLQPEADSNDEGTLAWLTDPGPVELEPTDFNSTDVDEGTTMLQAPPMTLRLLRDPVVAFSTWHSALVVDGPNARVSEATGDDLVATLSVDGQPYVEVDRDATNSFTWRRKSVRLRDVLGGALDGAETLTLRFTAGDRGPEQNSMEAGLDDLTLTDVLPECVVEVSTSSSSRGGNASGATSGSSAARGSSSAAVSPPDGTPPAVVGPCACVAIRPSHPAGFALLLLAVPLLRRHRRR